MRLTRSVIAIVLFAVLLVAVAPAVQAAPPSKPKPSSRLLGSDLLSAALTWLSSLFDDRAPRAHENQQKGVTSKPSGGTVFPTDDGGRFAGSCIDPLGCSEGGG